MDGDPERGLEALDSMDEAARYARFDRLQLTLPGVWKAIRKEEEAESVVVLPSVTLDRVVERSGGLVEAYEERFLFLLLLLRQPKLRMIYITSQPIAPPIIEYYLSLLPGVIPSHVHARLTLVAVNDSSPRPLSAKLLERPQLLRKIRKLIPDPALSHLVPYNTTTLERDVSLALGIPMYGADPRLFHLGTKSGCRTLFAEEGVPHPVGFENLQSRHDLVHALRDLRAARPEAAAAIVKLNEGVSGEGNAQIDLSGLVPSGPGEELAMLDQRVASMTLESRDATPEGYLSKLEARGGVVEEMLLGEVRSPSVQLRVTPLNEVEVLSTHDQILGGPSGQSYLGCRFPADPEYSEQIIEPARRIGERLAREGVLGRFAIDFVVGRRPDGQWETFAIELNLRKGGTTHPFLTLQFLTDGSFDADSGLYKAPSGVAKFLVATDHLESTALRALAVDDLFDIVIRRGLHFDQSRQSGVVFHMISSITECGQIGLTAIGDSPQEADTNYETAERLLLKEAEKAGRGLLLPAVAR
jgi:PGM1 C-terminal domain